MGSYLNLKNSPSFYNIVSFAGQFLLLSATSRSPHSAREVTLLRCRTHFLRQVFWNGRAYDKSLRVTIADEGGGVGEGVAAPVRERARERLTWAKGREVDAREVSFRQKKLGPFFRGECVACRRRSSGWRSGARLGGLTLGDAGPVALHKRRNNQSKFLNVNLQPNCP
jgi:hypothetical protein